MQNRVVKKIMTGEESCREKKNLTEKENGREKKMEGSGSQADL